MTDPYSYWSRYVASWFVVAETVEKLSQTLFASSAVIGARTKKMEQAVQSPLAGDYAELTRMVPEKAAAFSLSFAAGIEATMAMQREQLEFTRQAGRAMAFGRPPTIAQIAGFCDQASNYPLRVFEMAALSGRDMLAPVYRQVSANARRLAS